MKQHSPQLAMIFLLLIVSISCTQQEQKTVSTRYLKILKQNLEQNNRFLERTARRNLYSLERDLKRKKTYASLYFHTDTICSILDELIEKTSSCQNHLLKEMSLLKSGSGHWFTTTSNTDLLKEAQTKIIDNFRADNIKVSSQLYQLQKKRSFGVKEDEIVAAKTNYFLREHQIKKMLEPSIEQADIEEFTLVLAQLINKVQQNKLSFTQYLGSKVSTQSLFLENLHPYSVPRREIVPVGSDFESNILLCLHPGELGLSFEINGKPIPTSFGIGKYKTKRQENKDHYTIKATVFDNKYNFEKEYKTSMVYDTDWWYKK